MSARAQRGDRSRAGLRAATVLAAVTLAAAGCASVRASLPGMQRSGYSEQDLRADLDEYAGLFLRSVGAAADRIEDQAAERVVRMRALLWKARMSPLIQEAAYRPDPQEAFVDTLTLAAAQHQYLTEGDGRELFRDQQPIAVEVADELVLALRDIGVHFLDQAQMEVVEAQVRELTQRHQIRGTDFSAPSFAQSLSQAQQLAAFRWIVDIPMSPVRALERVGSGAAAIHDFNKTAERFSAVVAQIPTQLRWELEILTYDLEDRDTTVQGLAAFESLADSVRRFADSVGGLPADLQAAVGDSQAAIESVEAALREAQAVAGPLAAAAEQIRLASASWEHVLARGDGEEAPPGRPFDIREWEATAQEIQRASASLQGLAVELRALSESDDLKATLAGVGSTLDTSVDHARASANELVDAAAWRALQLLLVFFALLAVYRLWSARLGRRA
jgi:hypothetical protein